MPVLLLPIIGLFGIAAVLNQTKEIVNPAPPQTDYKKYALMAGVAFGAYYVYKKVK